MNHMHTHEYGYPVYMNGEDMRIRPGGFGFGYGRPGFGFGRPGFGFGLPFLGGFVGGLAVSSLARPPYYPYPPYNPYYPYPPYYPYGY